MRGIIDNEMNVKAVSILAGFFADCRGWMAEPRQPVRGRLALHLVSAERRADGVTRRGRHGTSDRIVGRIGAPPGETQDVRRGKEASDRFDSLNHEPRQPASS